MRRFKSLETALLALAVATGCGGDAGHTSTSTGGATNSTGGAGTTTGGAAGADGSLGTEGKACYPNGTCNASLTCLSNLCVNPASGAGGTSAAGGTASGNGGEQSAGGGTADGGKPGTGGRKGTGGAMSTGGATGTGGATTSGGTTGTGGATTTGGATSTGGSGGAGVCYPVDPTQHDANFVACAPGLGCYPTPTGDSHCAGPTTASGLEGADCFALSGQPDDTKCAPGYFCDMTSLKCTKYCRVAMPFCPNSELCEIFPSRAELAGPEEIGFCE